MEKGGTPGTDANGVGIAIHFDANTNGSLAPGPNSNRCDCDSYKFVQVFSDNIPSEGIDQDPPEPYYYIGTRSGALGFNGSHFAWGVRNTYPFPGAGAIVNSTASMYDAAYESSGALKAKNLGRFVGLDYRIGFEACLICHKHDSGFGWNPQVPTKDKVLACIKWGYARKWSNAYWDWYTAGSGPTSASGPSADWKRIVDSDGHFEYRENIHWES